MRDAAYEHFVHGERYVKTPELVKDFVEILPIRQNDKRYVVFKPLKDVDPKSERPDVIILLADPDQLAALVVLANYARVGNENVIIPQAAGCQSIGIYPMKEAESENPRAVIGLVDLSARVNIRKQLAPNLMSFAMSYSMFEEMESSVEGSLLEMSTWKKLLEKRTVDSAQ